MADYRIVVDTTVWLYHLQKWDSYGKVLIELWEQKQIEIVSSGRLREELTQIWVDELREELKEKETHLDEFRNEKYQTLLEALEYHAHNAVDGNAIDDPGDCAATFTEARFILTMDRSLVCNYAAYSKAHYITPQDLIDIL